MERFMDYYRHTDLEMIRRFVPDEFINFLEKNYYKKISDRSSIFQLVKDPQFIKNPKKHVGLFTDHGMIHACDIAQKILIILKQANGLLICKRDKSRLNFMCGMGVIMAMTHDIGMSQFTNFARIMHAEIATQEIFSRQFDSMIDFLWNRDVNHIPWYLSTHFGNNNFSVSPKLLFREILAMVNCHSKSKVPYQLLDNPVKLRKYMLQILSQSLHELNSVQNKNSLLKNTKKKISHRPILKSYYSSFKDEAYHWLISSHPEIKELVRDVIDIIRCLRVADSLRQRGVALKTSHGYQIFIDQTDGRAIYALNKFSSLFYFTSDHPINAGEANISQNYFDRNGDLHIRFYRGSFFNIKATEKAAYACAVTVTDIVSDLINAFPKKQDSKYMYCYLEAPIDNPKFAVLVKNFVKSLNLSIYKRCKIIPNLECLSENERELFFSAKPLYWNLKKCKETLTLIGKYGFKINKINPQHAFKNACIVNLKTHDVLIKSGSFSEFVYIPLGRGLSCEPLGGYKKFFFPPYCLIGTTGVIMGGIRNADVIARKSLRVVMINALDYLKYWHDVYHINELPEIIRRKK